MDASAPQRMSPHVHLCHVSYDERRTGTREGRSDPAPRWSSSFRSGIGDRTVKEPRRGVASLVASQAGTAC
jgi:hypothetical protein